MLTVVARLIVPPTEAYIGNCMPWVPLPFERYPAGTKNECADEGERGVAAAISAAAMKWADTNTYPMCPCFLDDNGGRNGYEDLQAKLEGKSKKERKDILDDKGLCKVN